MCAPLPSLKPREKYYLSTKGKGQTAYGRPQVADRKGHNAEGKRQRAMAYWRVHRAEGRGQVTKGRRQRADGTLGTRKRTKSKR